MPLHLKHAISIPTQTQTVHVLTSSYLYYLNPSRIYTLYIPLRYRILYLTHSNTQRNVYHSMPLHTYTVNFATSSNLQEILSNSLLIHLLLLIMYGIIPHIEHIHPSNIIFYI